MSTVTIKRSGNTMIIGDRPQLIVDLKNQKNLLMSMERRYHTKEKLHLVKTYLMASVKLCSILQYNIIIVRHVKWQTAICLLRNIVPMPILQLER